MKKKFLTFILSICFIIPCMFMFSACSTTTPADIEFKVENGYIQYYDGSNWNNLIAIEELEGEDGDDADIWTIGNDGYWYKNGSKTNKKAVGGIGANGNGIKSIAPSTDPEKTNATQTTYIITLDDNSTYEFTVKNGTNGSNGDQYTIGTDGYWYKNGVKTDDKAIGEDGDEYTIGADGFWYKNGNKTTYKALGVDGSKGNGIKSITIDTNNSDETKTTYIITLDDNSTYSYEVLNGTDGISYYVHIKYADEKPTSNSITLKNYASDWMGIYTGTSKTAPATYSSYTWYCIKGQDAEIPNVEVTFEYTIPEALTSRGVELSDISNITSYYNGENGLKFGTATTKSSTWLGVSKMPYIYNTDIPSSWFKGWFIKGTEKQIDAYTCIGSDITVEMRWDENQVNADLLNSELYTYGSLNSITGYTGTDTNLVLPAYYVETHGNGSKSINPVEELSSLPSNITGLNISRNITDIVVRNWANLTSITVDDENAVYDSRNNCNAIIETATNKLILGCSTTELPYDVVEIGNNAFINEVNDLYISKNCLSLTIGSGNNINNLYLPYSLEVFDNKSQIENIYYSGTIENWCSVKSQAEYSVFDDFARFNGEHLFVVNSNSWKEVAGEITIAETALNIANFAFEGLNINRVNIEGVKTIGAGAFRNCTNLTTILLTEGLTKVNENAFECSSPNPVDVYFDGTIEDWCNIEFANLQSHPLYAGKNTVGQFYIKNDTEFEVLKDLTIPSSITEIKPFAFVYNNLNTLTINDSVITIGEKAFSYCEILQEVVLSNNLEYVDGTAFYNAFSDYFTYNVYGNGHYIGSEQNPYMILVEATATSITDITIHKDCKFMVDYAFINCSQLISVNLEKDSQLKEIPWVFSYCTKLESLTLSKHITEINENVFEQCTNFNTVYYQGTEEEWNNVFINTQNTTKRYFTNATKYFYSETQPTGEGNYWHYDTDGITPIAW